MATKTVEQTELWDLFENRSNINHREEDVTAVKEACACAEDLLTRIPETFPTYTLHNATHIVKMCVALWLNCWEKTALQS